MKQTLAIPYGIPVLDGNHMSLARKLRTTLRLWLNVPAFAARSRLAWRRAGYHENPRQGARITATERQLVESPRGRELAEKLGLAKLKQALSERAWQINLVYADLLEQALAARPSLPRFSAPLQALDIGSKNFEYAPALCAALRASLGAAPRMTGIEIDAWRVYPSLHSRHDAAQYYLGLIDSTAAGHRYLAEDLLCLPAEPTHAVITWFYPFLTPLPLARWGLPRRCLRPRQMLGRALELLAPGGLLLIVNQTAAEAREQRRLLREAGCPFQMKRIQLNLSPGAPSRWVFFARAASECPADVATG